MIGLLELLAPRGLDVKSKVKIVRHQDDRVDLARMEREGTLELYQAYQRDPVFNCDYIVPVIGTESSRVDLIRFDGQVNYAL